MNPTTSRGPRPLQSTAVPLQQGVFIAPFGQLGLVWRGERLLRVQLLGPVTEAPLVPLPPWLQTALQGYFADPQQAPTCPSEPVGTAFQRQVWALIETIPCGQTRSYRSLAAALNTSPRALGGACRANPLPLLVPCHRVVGTRGLGGFAGAGAGPLLAIKRWLLNHEGVGRRPEAGR